MTALESFFDALRAVPRLPDAACLGHPHLFDRADGRGFDPEVKAARDAAKTICGRCPELDPCRAWIEQLTPGQRPRGVVGGLILDPHGELTQPEGTHNVQ